MEKTKKQRTINKLLTLLLAFVMVFTGMGIGSWGVSEAWADTVVESKPSTDSNGFYKIETAAELLWFQKQVSSGNKTINAELATNIDLTNVCGSKIGNWTVMPSYAGTFDGKGHSISGLYIKAATSPQGLFGKIEEQGVVKNLGIIDSKVELENGKARTNIAILAGENNGTILNCFVSGSEVSNTITNTAHTGRTAAVCGFNNSGKIINCYSINNTISTDKGKGAGGIVGRNIGSVENSYTVNNTLTGGDDVHPICAVNVNGKISNCYYAVSEGGTTKYNDISGTTEKDIEWFKLDEAINALSSRYFVKDTNDENGGFPKLTYKDYTADKSALKALLDKMPSSEAYFTENDRYNGKATSKNGFWADMEAIFSTGKTVYNNENATQDEVDSAVKELQGREAEVSVAIANLIPITHINPTELYETLNKKYNWGLYGVQEGWYTGGNDYLNLKADTTTLITWNPYAAAIEDGKAFLASMYDAKGNPTGANNSAAKDTCAEKVQKLQELSKALVLKENYEKNYNVFVNRLDEAKALLVQYAPTKFGSDENGTYNAEKCAYTEASWNEYIEAYKTLKTATEYEIQSNVNYPKGGTRADYDAIRLFKEKIENFQDRVNALVTTKDIEISVSYINNSAARHSEIKQTGTDIYYNPKLALTGGNTTIKGIVEASGISFDSEPAKYTYSQGNVNEKKDSIGINLMIFVNGECRGIYEYKEQTKGAEIPIQLHEGESVSIVRIPSGFYIEEASSGDDSTQKYYELTRSLDKLGDSVGQLRIDSITQNIKAGDAVSIKTSAEGNYVTNKGQSLSAENLTLFVSEKYEESTDILNISSLQKTTATTDKNGNAEYVFREPGWYTIAIFDLQKDTPEVTDVYRNTTRGSYPGAKAGAYMQVYVAEADNEIASLNKWRKENLAEAQKLYAKYQEYDFETGVYDAFAAAYETLKQNQEAETASLKNLMDAYDRDLEALNAFVAQVRDHEALVEAVQEPLAYLPETAAEVTYPYKGLLNQLKTAYEMLNSYEKENLLTPAEQAKIEMLMAIDGDSLTAPAQTTITIEVERALWDAYGGHNEEYATPDYDSPWQNTVYNTDPTGKESRTYVKYGNGADGNNNEPSCAGMGAYEGDRIVLDRLMHQSDSNYWMMFSLDGGKTWEAAKQHWKDSGDSVLMRAEFEMPATDGNALTVKLKGISKADYEALNAEAEKLSDAEREAAKSAIQAAYAGYDLSKYDETGKAALKKALDDGLDAVTKAGTKTEAAEARKAALAAMAAIKAKSTGSGENPGTKPSYDSGKTVGSVSVLMENTTYGGGNFTGTIVSGTYSLGENDSMMTVLLKALEQAGYSWNGTKDFDKTNPTRDYSITYLASIQKDGKSLGEFDGSKRSGWMGTLNDWFTNEGFDNFTYKNGGIESGDEIHVMFTMDYGEDLGGTWNNSNTKLKGLTVSGGTLSPSFSGSQTEYTLMITGEKANVTVKPEAANKNYQARIFLNAYNKDSARYKKTETISVKSGDIIYVGVGESGWPTMNSGGTATKYTIKVVSSSDANAVKNMLTALKSITYSNYKAEKANVESARAAYNAMTDKSGITAAELKKLTDAEAQVKFYTEIDDAKTKLNALTDSSSSSQAREALNAYNKLNEEQKKYITEADVKKFNELAKKYSLSGISGAAEMPESEVETTGKTGSATTTSPAEVKMSGTTATVTVKADNQKEILKQAKEKKSAEVVLTVAEADSKGAEKYELNLDKSFIQSLIKDTTAKLVVKTPIGQKTYDRETLQKLADEATTAVIKTEINKDNLDQQVEEPEVDAAALTAKLTPVARSAKTAKKNVKVTVSLDKQDKEILSQLKEAGYTVKYRFYRSTKKSAGFKSTVTKKTATYTNTSGKTGTKYFYKVQVRVYDENGKLVAKTALKQCKYASRTWSKK